MKKIIRAFPLTVAALFLSAILSAQQKNSSGLIHVKVRRLNDAYIDVYYNTPVANKKLPLLVFCQGSGYDSNTEGFLGLLQQFKNKAVGLAIEKQGVHLGDKGDSVTVEYKQHNTIYNRLYDYLRVLQYMKANAPWWNGQVYVIGGSEGGLLAGMLASFYPNAKAVAILSFGGGLSFGEAWPISSGLQKKAEGATSGAVAKEASDVKDSLAFIAQNATYLKSYSGEDNTYAWWSSVIDLRLGNALIDLQIPIYIGQGTADIMAPPASAVKLKDDFIKAGKTNLYYKEYKGYTHEFSDAHNKPHLAEVFMEAIQWMLDKQ